MANTAYAFSFDSLLNLIGIKSTVNESDNSNVVIAIESPIILKYNLDKILPTTKRIILPQDYDSKSAGQCVGYVKYITGVEYSGNAILWKQYINSDKPEIGSIAILQVGRWGHLALVISVNNDTVTLRSRNWEGLWIISDNEFNINDIRILGYIKI